MTIFNHCHLSTPTVRDAFAFSGCLVILAGILFQSGCATAKSAKPESKYLRLLRPRWLKNRVNPALIVVKKTLEKAGWIWYYPALCQTWNNTVYLTRINTDLHCF
jgi:hypothetical protein